MGLTEYSAAMLLWSGFANADLQRQILKLDQQLRQLNESVTFFNSEIDRRIAFDASLKNDTQRKAQRKALMGKDGDYISVCTALKETQDKRALMDIDLQLLKNQFSVMKLERRGAIAQLEAQAAA